MAPAVRADAIKPLIESLEDKQVESLKKLKRSNIGVLDHVDEGLTESVYHVFKHASSGKAGPSKAAKKSLKKVGMVAKKLSGKAKAAKKVQLQRELIKLRNKLAKLTA
jgi:hypothetical protein